MSESALNDSSVDKRKLIALVKQYPTIYNTHLNGYTDRVAKEQIWEEVALKLNTTSNLAKSRWSILRSCFRREIRQQNQKIRAGKFKARPWNYVKDMEFILPFLQNNDEQISNTKNGLIKDLPFSDEDNLSNASFDADTKLNSSFDADTKLDNAQESLIQFVDCSSNDVEPKNSFPSPSENGIEIHSKNTNYFSILSNASQSDCNKSITVPNDDSLVHFFASMLATVKTFPTDWQIKAKMAVFQQVTELEMQINQQKNK